jgi:hypothetical protein
VLVEPTGIFDSWAASMRHRDLADGTSELIYRYSITIRPRWFGRAGDAVANLLFAWETCRRFRALANYLNKKLSDVEVKE